MVIKRKAAAHVICIPYYEKFIGAYPTLEEAIRREFFSPRTLFYEARVFLMGEYRAVESYYTVLELLARGVNEVKAISDKSKLAIANVSAIPSSLERQDLIRSNKKILSRGRNRGWRHGYLAFYFRYVHSYVPPIEDEVAESPYRKALEELDSFVGRFIEEDFRKNVLKNSGKAITETGALDFPNPLTKQNEEMDLVADEGGCVLVGECKWKHEMVGTKEYETLIKRASLLFPSEKVQYYLLSLSGYTDELLSLSNDDLHLITGADLFKTQQD